MKDKKRMHKLLPYPSYDVEAIQSWLQQMSKQGWYLEKDGFFMGVVSFEKGEKKSVRYRLEASLKSTSMWADNNGDPDEEAVELNRLYGWEYVSKCKDFYIYRCDNETIRELNTDPLVQELAFKEVCKRQSTSLFTLFFWLVIYQFAWIKSSFFLTMIQIGTGFFLFGELLVFWIILDSLKEFIHLNRLRKKLKDGESLLSNKNQKKQSATVKNFIQVCMLAIWIFTLFVHGNDVFINKRKDKLNQDLLLPFATMIDFARDEHAIYREEYQDFNMNGIESWSDWLTPVNINWSEHALIKLGDNKTLDGGLHINYHETINPWLAEKLAQEYVQIDKKQKDFEVLECPPLDVDHAVAYMNHLHFPTVVLQKGNQVIHAYFYQTSPSYQIEFEEWVKILAESIQ